jgi:hypothetical protein
MTLKNSRSPATLQEEKLVSESIKNCASSRLILIGDRVKTVIGDEKSRELAYERRDRGKFPERGDRGACCQCAAVLMF